MTTISKPIEKIWIDPPKFWAATREMTREQIESLSAYILQLAEDGDISGLRQIEFLSIEAPPGGRRAA